MYPIYTRLLERSNDPYLLNNIWYKRNTRHRTRKQVQATWDNGEHFHTWRDLKTAGVCLSVPKPTLTGAIARNGGVKKYPKLRFSFVETDGVVWGRPVVGYYQGDLVYEWPTIGAAAEELSYTASTVGSICKGKHPQFGCGADWAPPHHLKGLELFFVDSDPYAG